MGLLSRHRLIHPDCDRCCQTQRCHFCLQQPGTTWLVDPNKEPWRFAICVRCREMLDEQLKEPEKQIHAGVRPVYVKNYQFVPMKGRGESHG